MAKPAISRIFALRILRISQNLAYNERRQQHCYQKKEFLHFSTLIKVFSLVKWWMCNNNGFFVTFSPLSRRRAPQKLPKKEFELSEHSEFPNSRQLQGAQGIRHGRTSDRGALSFGSFSFGQAKKMNNGLTSFVNLSGFIRGWLVSGPESLLDLSAKNGSVSYSISCKIQLPAKITPGKNRQKAGINNNNR